MNNEEFFYKELSALPVLPSEEFNTICKKIHRKTVRRNIGIVGSITMVAFLFFGMNFFSTQKIINQQVEAELQYIQEFFNGEDISELTDAYAFYNNY